MEALTHNCGVDIYAVRKQNLESLLAERHETASQFARRTGVNAVYITQVLSKKTNRKLGDKVARRIETIENLPEGWLDLLDAPISALSARALNMAQKIDRLPEAIQAKLEADIDTLFRFHAER